MPQPTILTRAYQLLFRRTSSFAVVVVVGAFAAQWSIDALGDAIFDHINKGKQWPDVLKEIEKRKAAAAPAE